MKSHVSESKKKLVKEMAGMIQEKRTLLIASIKNLPASQYQEIGKKFRGRAIVKMPKKRLILRALEECGNLEAKKIEKIISEDVAVVFSDIESFELAGELARSKCPAAAKIGQEAPFDIEVPAGPTELVPGPAISELGALGIQIQIKDGKIEIRQAKVITKKGQKISEGAAGIMNKLGIKPFQVGFVPLASFDSKENKIYTEIKIDIETALNELKTAYAKSLPFALNIGYICTETIKSLVAKAQRNTITLQKSCSPENGGGK